MHKKGKVIPSNIFHQCFKYIRSEDVMKYYFLKNQSCIECKESDILNIIIRYIKIPHFKIYLK